MIFENQINVIDLIALLITLLSTLASTWRGLIKETLTIIVWILSLIISNGLFSTVDFLENDELSIVEGTSFNLCSLRENGIGVSVIPISPKGKVLKKLNLKRFKNLK